MLARVRDLARWDCVIVRVIVRVMVIDRDSDYEAIGLVCGTLLCGSKDSMLVSTQVKRLWSVGEDIQRLRASSRHLNRMCPEQSHGKAQQNA